MDKQAILRVVLDICESFTEVDRNWLFEELGRVFCLGCGVRQKKTGFRCQCQNER